MRNLSMGQLLAEVASMAIKKGMIEEEAAAFACADAEMPCLIPDFRTVNFLNLSQSSERPGRAAAHYPQNKTPQLAGFCHSAHRTAGIGGIGAIQASLMNVSRVSFGEVQRSLAGIKSYAQVACAELFRHSVHRRQVELGLVEQRWLWSHKVRRSHPGWLTRGAMWVASRARCAHR